jgi:hypothetical protein
MTNEYGMANAICLKEWPLISNGVNTWMEAAPTRRKTRKPKRKPRGPSTGLGTPTAEFLRNAPPCDKAALLDLARIVEEAWKQQ